MTRLAGLFCAALVATGCVGAPPASPATTASPARTAVATPLATAGPSAGPISTPRPTPTPVTGVGLCPTDSPITVGQFMDANPACFGDGDIEIRGWLDHPPGTGFEPPFVEPGWLSLPVGNMSALWETPPEGPDHFCPPAVPCSWFFPHIDPASGLTLDFPQRWIIATGHVNDPIAETCHYVYPEDWTEERLDDALAVESCRTSFVITAIWDAP